MCPTSSTSPYRMTVERMELKNFRSNNGMNGSGPGMNAHGLSHSSHSEIHKEHARQMMAHAPRCTVQFRARFPAVKGNLRPSRKINGVAIMNGSHESSSVKYRRVQ